MPDWPWRSRGSNRQPMLTQTRPIAVRQRPTGAKSNIWNGFPNVVSRIWLTMMFVEVPTRVTRPPSSDMNDIGIAATSATSGWPAPA